MLKRIAFRTISFAIAITMIFGIGVASAKVLSGTCGDDAYWAIEDGHMIISGTGEFDDASAWGLSRNEIISVEIQAGITSIADDAFYGCGKLESVSIADTVTEIGDRAFYACSKLESIAIPASVEDLGDYAFGSTGLKTVVFNMKNIFK